MKQVTLLGSVFLSHNVLEPLAGQLEGFGYRVQVCARPHGSAARSILHQYAQAVEVAGRQVLVGHSNAGAYLPALAGTMDRAALVFMDAILPPFRGGTVPLVPKQLANALAQQAAGGLLPPWTS